MVHRIAWQNGRVIVEDQIIRWRFQSNGNIGLDIQVWRMESSKCQRELT
jgi:hypothetical protein